MRLKVRKQLEMFDIEPRVAMLSFSTKGSAKSAETEKVAEAVEVAKERDPELIVRWRIPI